MMKLTYLGQMCYLIECDDLKIVTDPYLSDSVDSKDSHRNYPPPTTLCELLPDIIVISHPHGDHLDKKSLEPFYNLRRRAFTLVPAPAPFKYSIMPMWMVQASRSWYSSSASRLASAQLLRKPHSTITTGLSTWSRR